MNTEEYKAVPYTIEVDWKSGNVWLNNHVSKEKIVITKSDAASINSNFQLIEAKKKGLF